MNENLHTNAPRQNPNTGRRQKLVGRIILVSGIVGLIAVNVAFRDSNPILSSILSLVAILGAIFGWSRSHEADRHFVQSASETLKSDRRPPTLYLRSFAGEADTNFEEVALAEVVAEIGPMVAIGRPGDELPPLGATRDYLPDRDWKAHVQHLMDQSSLVILVAGETDGLTWELSECYRRIKHNRLLVMVPNDEREFAAFAGTIGNFGLPITCPPFPTAAARRHLAGRFCGLLYFDAAWKGHFVGFQNAANAAGSGLDMADASNRAGTRLKIALSECPLPSNVTIKKPGFNWLRYGVWGYFLIGLLLLAIFVLPQIISEGL